MRAAELDVVRRDKLVVAVVGEPDQVVTPYLSKENLAVVPDFIEAPFSNAFFF